MAKLEVMPQKDVIDAFRGVVDFYRWCGLVIARSWPRGDYRFRSEAVKASQLPFAYIAKAYSALPGTVRDLYDPLASHGGLTAKDWATRLYINGYKNTREHLQPVPEQGLGEDPMQIHLLPGHKTLKYVVPVNASVPWTDIPLAAYIPVDAQHVILYSHVQRRSAVVRASDSKVQFRPKGGTLNVAFQQFHASATPGYMGNTQGMIAVGTDRRIQYKITIGAGPNDFTVWWLVLLGYTA